MASSKFYAYYIRGNKVGIIQHDYTLGSGQTLSQPGLNAVGARGDVLWKSPTEDVTDGLEIEYAYSPSYTFLAGGDQEGSSRHWIPLGYTCTNGARLAFVLSNLDFSASSAFTAGDKILVQGSSRWNGIHIVHSVAYNGMLVTKTSFAGGVGSSSITLSCNFSASALTITGNAALQKNEIAALFPEGTHYVFSGSTEAAADAANNDELFKVTSDGEGTLTVTAHYSITNGAVTEDTSPTLADATGDTVALAKVVYDPFYLYSSASFDVLSDEADVIDLPEYLSKALVYYVKAKLAEDSMEIEQKEYFMKEFHRILEKHESSKIWGARRIGSDETAIK